MMNTQKYAVVTGATKGIGYAIAQALAAQGYHLALCARNEAELLAMQQTFQAQYPALDIIQQVTDVSDKKAVYAFADFILKKWARIDVLVNNAGVFIPGQLAEEADGALELMINTNLYSAYYLTKAILPMMQAQKSGHIFNLCSVASIKAYPNGGSYSISKFALLGFTKVLREELKESGIKVTAILPGATWSDSWKGVDLPPSRLMEAADIAAAVVSALQMRPSAVVEEILIRPQLGDL